MRTRSPCIVLVSLAVLTAGGFFGGRLCGQDAPGTYAKPDPEALARWQAMRFGLFIHWGPVSLKGTEIGWSRGREVPIEEYDSLYKQFNPEKFNADEWSPWPKRRG